MSGLPLWQGEPEPWEDEAVEDYLYPSHDDLSVDHDWMEGERANPLDEP